MTSTKHRILSIILLLSTLHTLAQPKQLNIGNAFWYKDDIKLAAKAGLAPLSRFTTGCHYRLFDSGDVIASIIDLHQTEEKKSQGQVTFYTQEWVDESREKPTYRVYIRHFQLSTQQAANAYKVLQESRIEQLPTDTVIKGWEQGKDGVTYRMEYASHGQYAFKCYWTPSAQEEHVAEAKIIQQTIDSLYVIADIKNLRAAFAKQVPFEQYQVDPSKVSIRPNLTMERIKQYRKERDTYRKQRHIH